MPNSLEKIFKLIEKTGDNCVILDAESNPAYAVVKFNDYQKLVLADAKVAGLTEDELMEKVNQDIADWRQVHRPEDLISWQTLENGGEIKQTIETSITEEKSLNQAKDKPETRNSEENYYFEPIE